MKGLIARLVIAATLAASGAAIVTAQPVHAGDYSWTWSVCRAYITVYDRWNTGEAGFRIYDLGTGRLQSEAWVGGTPERIYWQWSRECGQLGAPVNLGYGTSWGWEQDFQYGVIEYYNPTAAWYVCTGGSCTFAGNG